MLVGNSIDLLSCHVSQRSWGDVRSRRQGFWSYLDCVWIETLDPLERSALFDVLFCHELMLHGHQILDDFPLGWLYHRVKVVEFWHCNHQIVLILLVPVLISSFPLDLQQTVIQEHYLLYVFETQGPKALVLYVLPQVDVKHVFRWFVEPIEAYHLVNCPKQTQENLVVIAKLVFVILIQEMKPLFTKRGRLEYLFYLFVSGNF